MKIAYFLDFPGCIGGASKVLLTQAYIMNKRGWEVVVVIPNDENGKHAPEFDEISKSYSIKLVTLGYSVATSLEGIEILTALGDYNKIFRLLIREQVDLIHSTQLNIAVELVARKLGIPHLMNIYPTEWSAFNMKWLDVYPHYHSADSDFSCKRWGKGLHIPSTCIRVAYQNNYLKIKKKVDGNFSALKVIAIGVLTEYKNQLEIIKFILQCKKNGLQVVLTILGKNDTPYGERCKEFVEINDLKNEVIFEGVVLNIEDYFAQSDVMILASTVESYPGVVVESMANKVPVIASPVGGIPELLRDCYNGFLAKGCSSEAIEEAFNHFLQYKEEDRIQEIVDHAYETYQHNHSFEVVGIQLEFYYEWILKNYDKKVSWLQIEKVKEIFTEFINKYHMERESLFTRNNLWFLYHLSERFNSMKPKKIVIWGAGLWGETALRWLEILDYDKQFIGFIDTYKEGEYLGYPIFEASEAINRGCDVILLAIGNINSCLSIMECLEKYGKRKNIDYFTLLHDPIRV